MFWSKNKRDGIFILRITRRWPNWQWRMMGIKVCFYTNALGKNLVVVIYFDKLYDFRPFRKKKWKKFLLVSMILKNNIVMDDLCKGEQAWPLQSKVIDDCSTDPSPYHPWHSSPCNFIKLRFDWGFLRDQACVATYQGMVRSGDVFLLVPSWNICCADWLKRLC